MDANDLLFSNESTNWNAIDAMMQMLTGVYIYEDSVHLQGKTRVARDDILMKSIDIYGWCSCNMI